MLPALAARTRPIATRPAPGPARARRRAQAGRCPRHVAANVKTKTRNSPAGSPSGRVTRSRTRSQPRCGLNASNALHERIVGVELRILPVQEERQPVCLVAVEAVIAPEGQVKTQENRIDQPARQRAGLGRSIPRHRRAPSPRASRKILRVRSRIHPKCAAAGAFGQRQFALSAPASSPSLRMRSALFGRRFRRLPREARHSTLDVSAGEADSLER